jgi:hypothetical protein
LNRERVGPQASGGQKVLSVAKRHVTKCYTGPRAWAGYCVHGNETSDYINGLEFLGKLGDNRLCSKQLEEDLYRNLTGQPVAISDPRTLRLVSGIQLTWN